MPGRRLFVRDRHVQAAHAVREQRHDLLLEILGLDVEQAVDHVLQRLLREETVYERRPAVSDRMADDAVLVWAAGVRFWTFTPAIVPLFREVSQDAVGAGPLDRQQRFQRRRRAHRSSRCRPPP
jgi:hypothetical protein